MEGRTDEFRVTFVRGSLDNDDVDSTGQCRGVYRGEFLVVLVRCTNSADRAADIVHVGRIERRKEKEARGVYCILLSCDLLLLMVSGVSQVVVHWCHAGLNPKSVFIVNEQSSIPTGRFLSLYTKSALDEQN